MSKEIRFTVDQETIDFLDDLKMELKIRYNGDVLSHLITEYKRLKKQQWSLNHITHSAMTVLTDSINQNIREELKRVRLGTNNTDRNTQILIELFNGLIYHQDIPDIITTEDIKMAAIKTAENIVHERIENKRQRKIDWEEKHQKKER
ncbi:hypothetical protein ACFCYN_18825 [Gottfriedia sp. NPDC056225]|uniref:hypothetical protein n=1 Tax=Gottfriedia sp. NPDC056225 TaxID=3345751 RepID=UPI0035D562EC